MGLFIKRINAQGAMAALYTGAFLGISRLVSEVYQIENILTQPLFLHFAFGVAVMVYPIIVFIYTKVNHKERLI